MVGEGKLHKKFDIRKITRDDALQARVNVDHKIVKTYARDMKNGTQFPPLILFQDSEEDATRYWLADGWHRLAAYELNQQTNVPVSVHQGTYRDALQYALGANAQHGLRRSTADKQKAVDTFLLDPEWQQWANEEIAKRVHVDAKTVGNRRKTLEKEGKIPVIVNRKSTRNGKTTTTSTERIGRQRQAVQPVTTHSHNGVHQKSDEPQEYAVSGEYRSRNGYVAEAEPATAVNNQQHKNDVPDEVFKIKLEQTDTDTTPNGSFKKQNRREPGQAMGNSADLLTQLQDTIAYYKAEHPLLPDVFVQNAIKGLWSAWSGFLGVPVVAVPCRCQASHFGLAADRAPVSAWQSDSRVAF